ncbi:type 2 lantipeptide synthetase LanM [Paenibacillus albidus]|uniref:type 2 lanthipeptide synthetase LanM n=1 Tax=Paenibacillus albidus TaxID=2041023 RepID=UPI001BE8CD23|nr:type 2 lanthipeptide synthetase LanM [Paenibacillus albidus]MBT2289869.1 type 2 lantipeptide synthetase LanM [Paenibacillus albidus]
MKSNKGYFNENDYFIPFFEYFLNDFGDKLNKELDNIHALQVDKQSVFHSLMINYKKNVYMLAGKTIIFEFHQNFNEFNEDNESYYYNEYNDLLKDPLYINNVLKKYPVLYELVTSMTNNFLQYTVSIINHYEADHEQIKDAFSQHFGSLKSITIDIGDAHCQGKSVALITSESGQIIYKPRSLKVDIFYKEIIGHFNDAHKTSLKVAQSLDRELYGWQEFIEELPCGNIDELSCYYYELGMHLGFIYMFGGSDFHYENIIAHGAKPFLIDLETLFQGIFDFTGDEEKSIELQVSDFIRKTVYKSTFFANTTSFEERSSLLIGGTANIENQEIETEIVENIGTDKISMKKASLKMKRGKNLPIYNGKIYEIFAYEKKFIKGFKKVYEAVRIDAKFWIDLVNEYPNFRIRMIVRPTYVYAQFLKSLLNPVYLSDVKERERVLSFFSDSYAAFKKFKKITPYEINDLFYGDVPYFYTLYDSSSIYSSAAQQVGNDLLISSPKREAINRIRSLTEKDMYYQTGLINMSLSATLANLDIDIEYNNGRIPHGIVEQTSWIEAETSKLINECIPLNNHAQWLSLSLSLDGKMVSGPVSFGLYDGLSGIGIYLAAYHKQFRQASLHTLIDKITTAAEYMLEKSMYKNDLSAYYGVSSYIYYVEQLRTNQLIDEESAKLHYRVFSQKVINEAKAFKKLDFIGGLAGTLKLLTNLYKATGMKVIEEAAHTVYASIRKKIQLDTIGYYWPSDIVDNRILAGFSHGITGICYALSEYFNTWQNVHELPGLIESALRYEDTLFDNNMGGWRDNRVTGKHISSPLWCHGSAGILLGRAKIKQNTDNGIKVSYLDEALKETLENGNNHNQGNSLCHGTMGNLDILLEVLKTPFGYVHTDLISTVINRWIVNFKAEASSEEWHNGIAHDSSSIGLMLGKTGQMYTMLRLQDAELPSVLLLD